MESTATKPGDALLRHYFVDREGIIFYVEQFCAPGWYKTSRLTCTGKPLDSRLVSMGELAKMAAHTNLREARAVAGTNAAKWARLEQKYNR